MKRSDRIKACLAAKTVGKDLIWVSLLYMAGVAVHFFLGNFPKKISVLADEALYFSMAQSLRNGGGMLCLNAHTGFNKVMYPLLLSPFFGIDDPVLRVKMITLFNSALIMSSVFIVYLIGKELEFDRGSIIAAVLITLLFPDMMYSGSFLSENLSFPLVLLAVLVWLKGRRSGKLLIYSAALGCLCYAGYLCKNTFLAFFLSFVLFELIYPLFSFLIYRGDAPGKRLGEYYNKRTMIGCGITIAVFAVCYALGNILLFGGGDSNAVGAVSGGTKIFGDPYVFFYMLYAFAYYLSASVIAVLALPIVCPAAWFKRMEKGTREIFSFLILYLLVSCAMVAYTIAVNEDVGSTLPRVHLRYVGSILLLFIAIFPRVLRENSRNAEHRAPVQKAPSGMCAALLAAAVSCAVMKGMRYESIDQSMLNIYLMISEKLTPLTYVKDDLVFYPASAAIFLILALIIFIVIYYSKRSPEKAAFIFAAFMLAVCFQNNRLEIAEYKTDYSAAPDIIGGIAAMNEYLDGADGEKRILYIAGDSRSGLSKTLITYFDHTSDIVHSNAGDMEEYADGSGMINVRDTEFRNEFYGVVYVYDRFEGFDYIITDSESDIELRNASLISEASGASFSLYRNERPEAVCIAAGREAFPLGAD